MKSFDMSVYRRANQDLANLSDLQLGEHFQNSGCRERRVFAQTETTTESMSMRWLRGSGLEIGAGRNPTPLVPGVQCDYADIAADSAFGGSAKSYFSLDGQLGDVHRGRYDFVIASYVLEHCDSFIRGIENLLNTLKFTGVAYIILPDVRYLYDANWMPNYNFDHHAKEYVEPLHFANEHDKAFLGSISTHSSVNEHADITAELAEAMNAGRLPKDQRFVAHKHTYRYADWLALLSQTLEFLGSKFVIEDSAFGRERMDCHFALVRR